MASYSFYFEGLEELQRDISKCVRAYPDETEKEVYRLAGQFTKDVNSKMPGYYSSGKRPIPDEWHRKRASAFSGGGYSVAVEIENTAPHWHLVENGHVVRAVPERFAALKAGKLDAGKGKTRKYPKSRSKNAKLKELGFAPGRHYCEDTRREWDSEFPGYISPFLDKMLKGHNL